MFHSKTVLEDDSSHSSNEELHQKKSENVSIVPQKGMIPHQYKLHVLTNIENIHFQTQSLLEHLVHQQKNPSAHHHLPVQVLH